MNIKETGLSFYVPGKEPSSIGVSSGVAESNCGYVVLHWRQADEVVLVTTETLIAGWFAAPSKGIRKHSDLVRVCAYSDHASFRVNC